MKVYRATVTLASGEVVKVKYPADSPVPNQAAVLTPAYATTLPGLAWVGRGPAGDPAGYPYSVAQIEAGQTRNTSGGLYVQPWTVRLAAYAPQTATGAEMQAVQQLFHEALASSAAHTALLATALRSATEKILRARVMPGKGEYAKELREGRDVFVCGLTVELLAQGDRGVI